MAAGLGARFGGEKQLQPVGPSGELIIDYSIRDAIRAGFDKIVFVVKKESEDVFRERIAERVSKDVNCAICAQELSDIPRPVPEGRVKPWGTAHAVWAARAEAGDRFAVINADDFYGADAFTRLSVFLSDPANGGSFCMVGYRLGNTLSETGAVSRGACEIGDDGSLLYIEERHGIRREGGGIICDGGAELSENTVVSMNAWGFTSGILPATGRHLIEFYDTMKNPLTDECYLPTVVMSMLAKKEARVRVLPTSGKWLGMTYAQDAPLVREAIAGLER